MRSWRSSRWRTAVASTSSPTGGWSTCRLRKAIRTGDGHVVRQPGSRLPSTSLPRAGELERKVYVVPTEIDDEIARLKLETMGVAIDVLTEEQARYLASWDEGT